MGIRFAFLVLASLRRMMKKKSSSGAASANCRLLFPLPPGSPEFFLADNRDLDDRSLRNVMKIGRSPDGPVAGAPATKNPATLSDVKEMVVSRMDSIRKSIDLSHSELLKDLEPSKCQLFKRVKLRTQSFMETIDEADGYYKKAYDRIKDDEEDMKASFAEFVAEAQSTATRVQVSNQEIAQSFEKAIEGLRYRYELS